MTDSSAPVAVAPVRSRRQWRQFLSFPWKLYAGDPLWTPPLRRNQEELVGRRSHPFYDRAESQALLALRGDEVVGRVLAIIDHAHNEAHHEQRGMFGFFECRDDVRAAHALFDAARAWCRERGANCYRGPCNPSMNYECGLLVEKFDAPATFMMTYNPEYYVNLVESYGWRKSQDLFAYIGHRDMLGSIDEKLAFVIETAKDRFEITTRIMNRKRFEEEVRTFLHLYNSAMAPHWGFVPLSEGELNRLAKEMKHLIVPELTAIAEVNGKVIGVCFCMPDFNPVIKEIDGRLFPFGFLKLLAAKRNLQRARVIATTVLPEYQRWGVGLVLLAQLLPHGLDLGLQEGEFSWVLETNDLSRKSLEKGGAVKTQTFRMYDLED